MPTVGTENTLVLLNIAKNTVVSFNLLQNLGKFECIFKLLEVCFCLFLLEIDKKVFNFNHRNDHKLTFNQKKIVIIVT